MVMFYVPLVSTQKGRFIVMEYLIVDPSKEQVAVDRFEKETRELKWKNERNTKRIF